MKKKDPRVDTYIAKSNDFAQPIMTHIRKLVHKACPSIVETLKWGFPHFDYKGIMCSMASFKNHCSFCFWKGTLMADPHKVMSKVGETAMGQFGRITSIADLPNEKILIKYIKEAAKLNDDDVKLPTKSKSKNKKELFIPSYFMQVIKKNKKVLHTFENFSYTNKKEYVEWITQAKTKATREKRLATALEWMAAGKVKNWKYIKN